MSTIDSLLTGEEPKQQARASFGLDSLHITRYAYEKAFRYAELIGNVTSRNLEIGGFLTKPQGAEDRVARDAFLARDQEVGGSSYKVEPADVIKAKKELDEKGQSIIGWWHSHGSHRSFHSTIDDGNQMVLLNQISPSNYITFLQEKTRELESRVEGDELIFRDLKNPSIEYRLQLKNADPELVAENLRILERKKIGFAYSFVVNCNRWLRQRVPYCEIATRDLCASCIKPEDKSASVDCEIYDEGEFTLDNDELSQEIREKVHVIGDYSRYIPKPTKKFLMPDEFERQRAEGTLKKPEFKEDWAQTPTISGGYGHGYGGYRYPGVTGQGISTQTPTPNPSPNTGVPSSIPQDPVGAVFDIFFGGPKKHGE